MIELGAIKGDFVNDFSDEIYQGYQRQSSTEVLQPFLSGEYRTDSQKLLMSFTVCFPFFIKYLLKND